MGSAANATIAAVTEISGAPQKISRSALSGIMSSLSSSFTASAIGCSRPCGPTRIGPSRTCMSAITLRSTSTMYPATSGSTSTITSTNTIGHRYCHPTTAFKIAFKSIGGDALLPVHFPQHDIQRPNDGHHVGHQVATHHLIERFQIDQRRRADTHAIRLRRAVAHDIVAKLALGPFNRVIYLSRRRLQNLAYLPQNAPAGNVLDGLQADKSRLPH